MHIKCYVSSIYWIICNTIWYWWWFYHKIKQFVDIDMTVSVVIFYDKY